MSYKTRRAKRFKRAAQKKRRAADRAIDELIRRNAYRSGAGRPNAPGRRARQE